MKRIIVSIILCLSLAYQSGIVLGNAVEQEARKFSAQVFPDGES